MRLTVGELRKIVREGLGGSSPSEAYDQSLMDDPAMTVHSVIVPDDAKLAMRRWAREMGLTRKRKKRPRSS